MITTYNVIFKYEGKATVRKYFAKDMEKFYKNLRHDKELLTDDACICIIFDKNNKYISEF